ncbi:MAG: B12-binding domain-containing radical SAM protein [Promethearchaeota archaeon]
MPNVTFKSSRFTVLPNLGIVSLAGNIGEDHEADVADLILVRNRSLSFLEHQISKHPPDLVGFSAMTYQAKTARYLARYIKQLDPEIRTIIGGIHATTLHEEIGQFWKSEFDFIIRGEGENTLNELLQTLNNGNKDLREIKGLSFKKNGSFIHNSMRPLQDLSTVQLPKRSARLLKKGFHLFGIKTDVVESSRGCVNNCKFCSITQMYGRSFRTFLIDRVLSDIEACEKEGAKGIFFVDDNLTLDPEHFGSLCDGIVERGLNKLTYITQASVKGLYNNPKLFDKIALANFRGFFLGIENPKPETLSLHGKKVNRMARKAEIVVSQLRSRNIIVYGGFIVANPDDNVREFYEVFNCAKELKLDIAAFQPLHPYPKTEIREILLKRGLVTNVDDYNYYGNGINVKTEHLNKKQIEFLLFKMFTEYHDIKWLFWNNIWRVYPKLFLKVLLSFGPSSLKDSFLVLTKIKATKDIAHKRYQYEKDYLELRK